MTLYGWIQIALYVAVLLGLAWPLGAWMARVYAGEATFLSRLLGPVERGLYRLAGVDPEAEMGWWTYAAALLIFNLLGMLALYALQRLQAVLPLNPAGMEAVAPRTAFNTAASFTSNTNWQSYSGEQSMSYLTGMLGLTVQNFVSAASGMAVLGALIRGFARRTAQTVGNFWTDLVRLTLYVLLPLSLVLAIALAACGVVQTLAGPVTVPSSTRHAIRRAEHSHRHYRAGPVASEVAIKQLGTNGGGFFGANSAHPFENPTPLSDFLEMLSILLIPTALCFTFGRMVGDMRQGRALLAVMLHDFRRDAGACSWQRAGGRPRTGRAARRPDGERHKPGGNMEGKEVRFGLVNSALWATATTAASNGSVNAMHDAFMPLGGLAAMWLIQFGEVIFGGVGSGLYGMLVFAIVAVFIAGLMVGRTPEYLGKKIEAFEMKMAVLVVLIPVVLVLGGTALAISLPAGRASILNASPHGLSEVLYAFSSAGNNNGSAFAGLAASEPFYNVTLGLVMLLARYWLIAAGDCRVAGRQKTAPAGPGTLPTHTPLFIAWLVAVVVIVGALSFLPALALGPIVEHLMLFGEMRDCDDRCDRAALRIQAGPGAR